MYFSSVSRRAPGRDADTASAAVTLEGVEACDSPDDIVVELAYTPGGTPTATEDLTVRAGTPIVMTLVVRDDAGDEVSGGKVEVDGRGIYSSGETLAFEEGEQAVPR